ncbi:hypothetical protein J4204_03730 [Candidatus Woesearchaeota archaeon]|nr:hypothetical protein [Candidatus Woesearchaeota archaeon]
MRLWGYGKKRTRVWNISKLKLLIKEHIYIIILLLLSVVFFYNILSATKILNNIHYINDMTFLSYNVKDSVFSQKTLHLWTPYFYSGQPLMAIPESYLFDLNFLFILIFRNIYLAMNLAVISYFFLAGLGMYLLIISFKKGSRAAFISALVYMLNGFVHSFIISGHLNILESYALIPFVFLFAYRAVKNEKWLSDSILAGLFFAMMALAGGIIFFIYTGFLIGIFLAFSIIGKGFLKRLLKVFLIGVVLLLALFGFAAIKLLPALEFEGISNRNAGVSYTEYLGYPVKLADSWHVFVSNIGFDGLSGALGIAAFILLAMSLFSYRNKNVVFFLIVIAVSIMLASGSFLAEMFYKSVPGFGKMRHIERAMVLFVFSASALAAYGYENLNAKLDKIKFKNAAHFFIIALILAELVALHKMPSSVNVINPKDIPILAHISNDKDFYRTINMGLKEIIGAAGYNYNAQLGIPEAKGGGGIWVNDYVSYLAVAHQYAPSKLLGILNIKYAISDRELDIPNFKLAGKFAECRECAVWNAFGPYLYENLELMPRAYVVQNAILVVGNQDASRQLIYSLMLNGKFNPKNTVAVQGNVDVGEHSIDFLKKFDVVILAPGSVSQESVPILREYTQSGGVLLPDILSGKNAVSNGELETALSRLKGGYKEAKITKYSNNKVEVGAKGRGLLVLSEVFAHYPGWKAFAGGKELSILKADNAITAVLLSDYDSIIFEYKPKPFEIGKIITMATTVIALIYFGVMYYLKRKNGR